MKRAIDRREFLKVTAATSVVLMADLSSSSFAEGEKMIELPKPQTDGGKPLMQILHERKTAREFVPDRLPAQVLSNLLWAACGINRPDGHRTCPSAGNRQEVDIYITTADGLYLYNAKAHAMQQISNEDIRALAGKQPFVNEAPLNLVYVADYAKMPDSKETGRIEEKDFLAAADTGFIGQNVYLFCASEGLSTVFRAMVDRPPLAKVMKLRPDQKITFAQSVGYPKR
jgi:SagB-type dehydrogenase family enzyme